MQVMFTVRVSLDAELIENLAARHHTPAADVVAEIVGDCECRLNDSLRFRDAVLRVGVELVEPLLLPSRPAA